VYPGGRQDGKGLQTYHLDKFGPALYFLRSHFIYSRRIQLVQSVGGI